MLSGPQRKFCERIVSGDTGEAAWRKAYPKASPAAARASASEALTKDNIKAEIQHLRDKADLIAGSGVLTLAEKRKFLAEVVKTPVGKVSKDSQLAQEVRVDEKSMTIKMPCKLKALELDAKLAGEFDEDKTKAKEADALTALMQRIAGG